MMLRTLLPTDVPRVWAIEAQVHAHPWSAGNFRDALDAGYSGQVLETGDGIVAYSILMLSVDEAEILTIGVSQMQQRRGYGRQLLGEMVALARKKQKQRVLLEVRASNEAAIALYQRCGFQTIGRRRGYYLTATGREDALLMGLEL